MLNSGKIVTPALRSTIRFKVSILPVLYSKLAKADWLCLKLQKFSTCPRIQWHSFRSQSFSPAISFALKRRFLYKELSWETYATKFSHNKGISLITESLTGVESNAQSNTPFFKS